MTAPDLPPARPGSRPSRTPFRAGPLRRGPLRRGPLPRGPFPRALAVVLAGVLALGTDMALVGATTATAASPSSVRMEIAVTADGAGPFTPGFPGPGGDTSARNGIVRTNDTITSTVSVSANDGTARQTTFRLDAPADTAWTAVPHSCTGAGSRIDGRTLVCDLGDLPEGTGKAVDVTLRVLPTATNGTAIVIDGTLTTAGSDAPVAASTKPVTVSAAPRYDLAKDAMPSLFAPGTIGPDGVTPGIAFTYPITLTWVPPVAGQGPLGIETLRGPVTFEDDVSRMMGGTPSTAQLLGGGGSDGACGINDDTRFALLPGGRGGAPRNVRDSGTIACTQTAPGAPVRVTVTGTDTALAPADVPTLSANGQALATGPVPMVVSGFIRLWTPFPTESTTYPAINAFTAVHATGADGAPNFGDAGEPIDDNTSERNVSSGAPGHVAKAYSRVLPNGSETIQSGKAGLPFVTPGTTMLSSVTLENAGIAPVQGATVCDVFDERSQTLVPHPITGRPGATSGFADDPQVEFAARHWTNAADAQAATCTDADGPWYPRVEDVPGGAAAVGAVRAVGTIAGGATAGLYSTTAVGQVANGTRVRDFGVVSIGDGTWIHNLGDPDLANGGLADFVVVSHALARVGTKVVDVDTTPETTPDATTTVTAGDSLVYAVYPSLTNATGGGSRQTVTVTDDLPAGGTYVPRSASRTPESVSSFVDEDGRTRTRLVWVVEGVSPNDPMDPITFAVQFDPAEAAGSVTNRVVVSTPEDASTEDQRNATRAVTVVNDAGVVVRETADDPTVLVGDSPRFTLTFTNTNSTPLDGVDIVDVLPYDADPLHSVVRGPVGLAEPVAVDPALGETVRYTSADPGSIVLDGDDPSNRDGGATAWCAESAFGAPGCPTGLGDVTGFRIVRTATIPVRGSADHHVVLQTGGARAGEVLVNRHGLRAAGLALPVVSNRATVTVVAGRIGDLVWDDLDGNGIQGTGEPGVGGVPVALSGTDDRGSVVARATITAPDGSYGFDGLRPGTYAVAFAAPDGHRWTLRGVGVDRGADSDADADGHAGPVELVRLTSDGEDGMPLGTLVGVTVDDRIDAGLVMVSPIVDPPVVPVVPVDPVVPPVVTPEPGDDGAGHARTGKGGPARPATLAYTGAAGALGLAVVAALAAVVVGGTMTITRRRAAGSRRR